MKETFNIYRGSYTKVLKYPQYNNAHWGKVTYADNFYIFMKELGICFEKYLTISIIKQMYIY